MVADKKTDISKTIEELEALQKSKDEVAFDGIDALEKALAEFDLETLSKAEEDDEGDEHQEPDADNKGGESDGDADNEGEGEEGDKGGEPVEKSITDQDLADELIKASEAYAELQGEVELMRKSHSEEIGALSGQVGDLCAAVADLTHLMQATGKGIVTLNKSVKEGMQVIGGLPAGGNQPFIGDRGNHEEPMQKSKSEVCGMIKSALNEGTLTDAKWLSKASVHGEHCLPDNVKKIIGLI